MTALDVLVCDGCGRTTLRRGHNQKYCVACSRDAAQRRNSEWQRANPPSKDAVKRRYGITNAESIAAGAARSVEARAPMCWDPQAHIDSTVLVRVAVPFDYAASKNAVWRRGRGGHVFARAESNALRESLALAIRTEQQRWFQAKLWIDIYVEKPDHKGDAVNVVDLVCDAVKDATGVDDRWYCILRVDWSIVKEQPRLIVGVRQEANEDLQVCSYCGRILALNSFTRNRSTATGRSRMCRDCSAPKRAKASAA